MSTVTLTTRSPLIQQIEAAKKLMDEQYQPLCHAIMQNALSKEFVRILKALSAPECGYSAEAIDKGFKPIVSTSFDLEGTLAKSEELQNTMRNTLDTCNESLQRLKSSSSSMIAIGDSSAEKRVELLKSTADILEVFLSRITALVSVLKERNLVFRGDIDAFACTRIDPNARNRWPSAPRWTLQYASIAQIEIPSHNTNQSSSASSPYIQPPDDALSEQLEKLITELDSITPKVNVSSDETDNKTSTLS